MIKTIVSVIKEQAEHIQNIKTFKYEGVDLINAQNNNATVQVIVESDIYVDYLVTRDLVKMTLNIDILDKVFQDDDLCNVQNDAFKIGVVLIKLLETKYQNIISVEDYSFITLDRFSDDELSGVRLTLMLIAPSPISVCNIEEFIDEENKYEENKDTNIEINIPSIDIEDLNINPISLKKNGK